MKKQKRVTKSSPGTCNLCGAPITDAFIDGRVMGGHWADVCGACFMEHGAGLGPGRGQLYRLDTKTGEFVKMEGVLLTFIEG
jgi:hypothetical protein